MRTTSFTRLRLASLAVLWLLCIGTRSTVLEAQSYLSTTGSPSFGAPYPVEMGTIDAASGNLHLDIPLGSYPQRGGATANLSISYDSHIWSVQSPQVSPYWMPYNAPLEMLNGGWYVAMSGAWLAPAMEDFGNCTWDQVIWAPNGTQHWFHVNLGTGTLASGCSITSTSTYALDSSGFEVFVTYQNNPQSYLTFTLYAPDGTLETIQQSGGSSAHYPRDTNGNYMVGGAGVGSGSDTLGRLFLQLPVSPASCLFTSVHPGGQYYACYNVLNSQGTTSQYTLSFADIPLKTSFGWSGVAECVTNCWTTVLTGITLPDGTSYSFKYDCDSTTGNSACNAAGSQSGYYGTLTQMTLPTGQQISYGYSMFGGVSWGNNHNQYPSWWVTSKSSSQGNWVFTPLATAGAGPANNCLPNYQVGCLQTTVDKADGSYDIISFIVDPYGGAWPQTIQNGTTSTTVTNTWDFSNLCTLTLCAGKGYQDVRKLTTLTTVPIPGGNLNEKIAYTYDTPQAGNVTGIKEWKYQSGTTFPTVPDRATYMTYATIGTNDINRLLTKTVCNNTGTDANCPGGGTTVARTLIAYDGYGSNGSLALASVTGVINHDDTNFGTSYTARGNPTKISQWVSGTTYLTTALSYDTTGQVTQALDSASNKTTYSYTDSFYNDNGSDPPQVFTPTQPTHAYVTSIVDNIGTTSTGYYYGTGQSALSTDYNSQTTYTHYVDGLSRPTKTDYPIGWSLNTYTSATQLDSYSAVGDTTASTSCTSCTHLQTILDSVGRVSTRSLVNNPAGTAQETTAYDGLNRVISASHPNFGASDPNNVVETISYDGLDRTTSVKHPDGQSLITAYGPSVATFGGLTAQQSSTATYGYGYPVLTQDEAGLQKQEWIDGFGRVIEVDEPSSSGPATRASGSFVIDFNSSQVSNTFTPCPPPQTCQQVTAYNSGTISVVIDGYTASYGYGPPPPTGPFTTTYVASGLASALNASGVVTAVANGSTVTMTSVAAGTSSNYSFTASATYSQGDCPTNPCFTGPSFYPSGGGTLSGGTGAGITSSPWVTTYTYDVLGNLTSVVQGQQTRTYHYDGLSRLTSETTPEAGTVTLSYVVTGTTLCSGDPSSPCSKTAPAPNQTGSGTVTTTYIYNTANQLTQKTHSDTTGTESYTYGTVPSAFNVGRLKTMTDPSGSETYSYNSMGWVTQVTKVIGTTSYTTKYAYNTAGELTWMTYPSGRIVEYSYDKVGHLCTVAVTAAANCGTSTGPYLTIPATSYDAASRPLSATFGNGVVATASYSPLTTELASLSYAKGSTVLFGLNYSYGNSIGNNGQIQSIADVSSGTGDSGRSVAYTYDAIGRLLTANTTGSTKYPAWGLSWTYDRYGNRTAQTVTAGSGYASSFVVNPVNNRITTPALTYDAAGNVMVSPSPLSATYAYDGEECNTGYTGNGNTATYTCDGSELRVKKVVTGTNAVTTVVIRSGGQVIAEYDNGAAVTAPTREYLYGNNLLAIVTGSSGGSGGTIVYQQRDHLSPRIYTDVNGNCVGDQGTYPFGEPWYSNNDAGCTTTGSSSWIYTSYERDTESGNDYALARSYANTQGRFLSPDPLEGHAGDPQSWNRYAYVENDPINLSDPSGQGFWTNLGFAIADLFAAIFLPEVLPEMTAAEAGAEGAGMTIQQAIAIAAASGMVVLDGIHQGANGVKTAILVCGGGPCAQDGSQDGSSSTTGSGGISGGGSEQAPVPGSTLPNGDVAVGIDIWHASPGCPNCGVIWGQSQDFVYDFAKNEVIEAAGGVIFESIAALRLAPKVVNEGIYEFTSRTGETYVGQSSNISKRIAQHLRSGKLLAQDLDTVKTTEVLGGKLVREIAEQLRIDELGGIRNLANLRNPIGNGAARLLRALMVEW